jgi:DNA-binding SARP family transcriptional activator/tetratricopeptide (TPR) repeat protein
VTASGPGILTDVRVDITLLGRFQVRLDGRPVPDAAWTRRQAAGLVKILALAPRRQLHRDQVLDALWPDVPVDEAGPRLHKAAHYARRALGPGSLVLRSENVLLFPDQSVSVDAIRFSELGVDASDPVTAAKAIEAYSGPLLPADRYDAWAVRPRERLELLRVRLLRLADRLVEIVDADPADGPAQLALMREHAAQGDRRAALRQFERMEHALHRELGVGPSDEAIALRDALLHEDSGGRPAAGPVTLIGRAGQTATLLRLLDEAAQGRGRTVFLAGAAGTGKSTMVSWLRGQVSGRGWRTGHGVASAIEGAWPYAPVLEALADLSRRHPTLLDGLDDRCREDIDRALSGGSHSGRTLAWRGDGSHQRLFLAVAELVRLAAAGPGLLLAVDDMHEADEASLRLLHYLARSCLTERLVIVLGHRRQPVTEAFEQVRTSLLGRGAAVDVPLGPLDRADTGSLAAHVQPGLTPAQGERIWDISGGLPFAIVELARTRADTGLAGDQPGNAVLGLLPPATRGVLEYVATSGSTFDTDEFLALSGLPEDEAFDCLDAAMAALAVERTLAGYRFRHPLIREALLDGIAPHRQRALHRTCAQRLIALDASPARIGHHLLAAGEPRAAVPYVLRAAETTAAVGAYRDALCLVDSIRTSVRGPELARTLALRADLLGAMGDPTALPAYRQAITAAGRDAQRPLRARLARLAVHAGDLDTAVAALDGLETDGGPDDGAILLARGTIAYFTGDLEQALAAADEAHRTVDITSTWERLEVISLKSLITHNRGEWSQLLRYELQRTRDNPGLATVVFDTHLCVAEYLLYGPTPYAEVIELARSLRTTAERAGALRAVAFAGALIGEAALLYGDLDLAEQELATAVDLHHEIGAPVGEAHSLQRLAEVVLARGDRTTANRLLRRALPLARWSQLSMHLLQRLYGTMVRAADDPEAARAVVDAAEATFGDSDFCTFCTVMFAVPAAIACADAGDLAEAQRYLRLAELSASMWEGTAWAAATIEARAHIARAEGDPDQARELLAEAADLFETWAQPLDAARCRAPMATSG